ncbi:glucose-6-phosphate isomerase [Neptunicoccus cionae]|uniref:glucose-6-phosphate isomerase n=1 Tax=Neptunicoccus cionae TaxID=2035344 RepID=UPI000C7727FC|nr:glucose-6-phosphate isomerase [Amylibacter cionae]PLS20685.1 glucose-6-phosphate isomerase [Amylibacter cionae]
MSIWQSLSGNFETNASRSILGLFDDPERFASFSARCGDYLLDYSKTNLDAEAKSLLLDLARSCGVEAKRDAMFAGNAINQTENRAVLHTALRNLSGRPVLVDGVDVMPDVLETLEAMKTFSARVRSGELASASGAPFTDVVNIGIGGSDLGPVMANIALSPYHDGPRVHFVSNVDGADIHDTLKGLDPATTLLIIASKTFTTIETMTNAETGKKWLLQAVSEERIGDHLAALSTARDKTAEFGIPENHVFGFADWVGGRYSVWGPIGLSVMLSIGPENFTDFLQGAEEMDTHFRETPLEENLPVLLALVGIWHSNICGYATRAVLPYDQRLLRLPAYLQQLDMESNGKGVDMEGNPLPRHSGPIVWGEPGTNGQHAFYQLIHQGTRVVPCEFLVARRGHESELAHQHRLLLANCLAQSEALMIGRSMDEARELMREQGFEGAELEKQAAHRVFPGNRPSVTMMYNILDPKTLGKIIALYEHRVFVEGVIWGINSFDQWGVELGKVLATRMLPLIEGEATSEDKDGSTRGLLATL